MTSLLGSGPAPCPLCGSYDCRTYLDDTEPPLMESETPHALYRVRTGVTVDDVTYAAGSVIPLDEALELDLPGAREQWDAMPKRKPLRSAENRVHVAGENR